MSAENCAKNNAENDAEKIGILGGTFDPIHLGHLMPTQEIAKQLTLEHVFLLPAHIPPHKSGTIASSEQRVAMVKLACQAMPLFCLDDRELKRDKPSFTVDTLTEIAEQHPSSQRFFFIGMDSLLSLQSWHRWQDLLLLTNLVVSERPGYSRQNANDNLAAIIERHQVTDIEKIKQGHGQIIFAQSQQFNISSTELRAALKQASNTEVNNASPCEQLNKQLTKQKQLSQYLLPNIIDYIREQQLYCD